MTLVVENLMGKPLTAREIQVIRLAARGLKNEEIATRLFVSADTVRMHMRRVIAKLDARDRPHAGALWLARQVRPVVVLVPRCRWHPTIAPLPDECPDCRWWVDAQRVLADMDALAGGRDA